MRRPILLPMILAAMLCGCHEDPTPVDVTPNTPGNVGVFADPINVVLYENGMQGAVKIRLLARPIANVYVTASTNDSSEFLVTPEQIAIAPDDWDKFFEFTLTPIDDKSRDSTQIVTLSLSTASPENVWNEQPATLVTVTVIDNGTVQLDCTQTPDDPQCQKPLDCTQTPDDPQCQKPLDCSQTPDDPQCQKPLDCSQTPDDPQCQKPLDCSQTPDNPQCQKPLDCSQTPDDPQCQKPLDCSQTPDDPQCQTGKTRIRFMAANTTSGSNQDYNDGKGIRMFQAMQPDIVMIQEFNYKNDLDTDFRSMVDTAFGKTYEYYRGSGSIPNGIISKYPIISSGAWKSNKQSNRNWDWAIIDLPGAKDLIAVSVHLGTSTYGSELSPLHDKIKSLAGAGNYYVVLGGDFNAKNRGGVRSTLGNKNAIFTVGKDGKEICDAGEFPVDQDGNSCTSAERDDPYDWLLFDKTLDTYEVPVEIGTHSYPNGHVLDSRVYADHGELQSIAPVKETDSWKCQSEPMCSRCSGGDCNNFQHMPVIRDIILP